MLVGFTGTFGTFYDDPANAYTQVVVEDPQPWPVRRSPRLLALRATLGDAGGPAVRGIA